MQWGLCRSGHGGDGGRGKENGCSGSGLMEKNIRLVFLVLIIFFSFFFLHFWSIKIVSFHQLILPKSIINDAVVFPYFC
jgi:hypothetical protein